MNLRSKIRDTITEVKSLEGAYKDKCVSQNKNMEDFLELSYLSGVHNGLKFIFAAMDGKITEEEYLKIEKSLLHKENIN